MRSSSDAEQLEVVDQVKPPDYAGFSQAMQRQVGKVIFVQGLCDQGLLHHNSIASVPSSYHFIPF